MGRRLVRLAAVALALAAVAPAASASHMLLVSAVATEETREDDARVARQPGGLLDGLRNRIVADATVAPGDGSLFLDSRWYVQAQSYLPLSAFTRSLGLPEMLFGSGGFLAYYGWWLDADDDGVIDDRHDRGCRTDVGCPASDEFSWKGIASGHNLAMALYVIPTNPQADPRFDDSRYPRGTFGAWANATRSFPDGVYEDLTSPEREEQSWVSGQLLGEAWTDESILTTTQVVTVADARRAGTEAQYDLHDPTAFVDVDFYEPLNSDVEALWLATILGARDTYKSAREAPLTLGPLANEQANSIAQALAQLSRDINALTRPVGNVTGALYAEAVARGREVADSNDSLWLKEPNHASDAFPGAAFGGIPSAHGIGNDYAPHASAHHLYMDLVVFAMVGTNLPLDEDAMPCSSCEDDGRGLMPTFIAGEARIGLWKDENGDKWIGRVCDSEDPAQWDSQNEICRPGASEYGESHAWGDAELVEICGVTTLSGAGGSTSMARGIVLRPGPGSIWEDAGPVFKVPQQSRLTDALTNLQEVSTPRGTEEVELEMAPCNAHETSSRSVDSLFIATGTLRISIVSELRVRMTTSYLDAATGIEVPPEEIVDVDVYRGSL